MPRLSKLVGYDLEHNSFYKIDKLTGEEEKTYKNGQKIKQFKPNVTGYHYLHRRKSQVKQQKCIDVFPTLHLRDKSLYNSQKNQYYSERRSKNTQSSILDKSIEKDCLQLVKKKNSIFESNFKFKTNQLQEQLHNKKQIKIQQLNRTLTNYTKLLKQRVNDNNSPLKDKTLQIKLPKDPLDVLCSTITHFHMNQPKLNSDKKRTLSPIDIQKIKQFSPKNTIMKQRQLYLKEHPEIKIKMTNQQIKIQSQRKKNLKILEHLSIRNAEKQTNKILQKFHLD